MDVHEHHDGRMHPVDRYGPVSAKTSASHHYHSQFLIFAVLLHHEDRQGAASQFSHDCIDMADAYCGCSNRWRRPFAGI